MFNIACCYLASLPGEESVGLPADGVVLQSEKLMLPQLVEILVEVFEKVSSFLVTFVPLHKLDHSLPK